MLIGTLAILLGFTIIKVLWSYVENLKVVITLSIIIGLVVIGILLYTNWFPLSWSLAVKEWNLRWEYFFGK